MGRALARELGRRGVAVRAISRTMARLVSAFPYHPVDKRAADARDVVGLSAALAGCDAVVDCIGLPADQMDQHVVAARTIAAVLKATGMRCIHMSSCWCYMPVTALPVSEDHPRRGGPPWAVERRAAEDVLHDAGAAVIHLPDFFGPHAHIGTLQNALADIVAGWVMNWAGSADVQRDYIYVPDAAAVVAELMTREDAYGEHWVVPGSGAISAREIAGIASDVLDRKVRVRGAGMTTLRLVALFDRELRDFLQIAPEYIKPVSYDGARLTGLIGPRPRTPYERAVRETIEWLQSE